MGDPISTDKGFMDHYIESRLDGEDFLSQVDLLMDWSPIEKLLKKHYKKVAAADGRLAYPALTMFKILLIQRWYGLSDAGMGYRGHGYPGEAEVHVDKRRRGVTAKSLWWWMKRRAAIEPGIGHLKREHRMDRNRPKGVAGDQLNAILSAAGMNSAKLLKWAADFLRLFLRWLPPSLKPMPLLA